MSYVLWLSRHRGLSGRPHAATLLGAARRPTAPSVQSNHDLCSDAVPLDSHGCGDRSPVAKPCQGQPLCTATVADAAVLPATSVAVAVRWCSPADSVKVTV